MHNGVFTTLDEVMNFYEKGGGKGLGLDYKYQTLPEDTLGLTATEQKNIIAFLHSLTDVSAAKK
jgi:cytochrome c peroxidase